MKNALLLCTIIAIALLTGGCSQENSCDEGVIQTPNALSLVDGEDYTASLLDCRLPKVQTFTIQGFEGGQIFGTQGGFINIPPQSLFNEDGEIIDGAVEVRLLEMFTPGDAIACQLSTNTRNAQNNLEPTLSEGLLYFDILFNGDPVIIEAEIQVFIPQENNTEQRLFFNSPTCPDVDCTVTWEIAPNGQAFPSEITDQNGAVVNGYSSFTSEAGWHSVAQFNPNQNERTTVYNLGPPGFDITNSNVFLSYDTDKIAVGLFEQYDSNLGVFSETFNEIPLETQGQLIFVSRQEGNFLLDTSSISVSQDIIGTTVNTTQTTEANLIFTINSL